MATTYTLISSVTVGSGGAATIEFTSIPATYTDLVVKLSANSSLQTPRVRFNNSSSSIYSEKLLYGQGASAASASNTNTTYFDWVALCINNGTSFFSNSEFYIPNYAGSNSKSVSSDSVSEVNASTGNNLYLNAGLWASSAAITSIQIFFATGNFLQYSTAYLYGISNA
jgi:hypothetical protein